MQTRAVIFDLDGLMVDTESLYHRAFNQVLANYGIPYQIKEEEYSRLFVGVSGSARRWLNARSKTSQEKTDEILADIDVAYKTLIENPANLIPMPGLFTLLDQLRAREIPLGVASNSSREDVETVLRGLEIISRFRVIVTGSDIARPKPAPDIYLCAIERLRVAPANCLALEDSASGIASAKAAGLRVIVVPNRFTSRQDLSQADARAEHLEQAIELFEQ